MSQFPSLREEYRRAEFRLRVLLFGDSDYGGGLLRGDEPRQHAALELRRMRTAFDEAVERGETDAVRADLAEELVDRAKTARKPQEAE